MPNETDRSDMPKLEDHSTDAPKAVQEKLDRIAERLRDEQETGKSVTTGNTASLQSRDDSELKNGYGRFRTCA